LLPALWPTLPLLSYASLLLSFAFAISLFLNYSFIFIHPSLFLSPSFNIHYSFLLPFLRFTLASCPFLALPLLFLLLTLTLPLLLVMQLIDAFDFAPLPLLSYASLALALPLLFLLLTLPLPLLSVRQLAY
jgi:hypothetical protein